MKKHLPNAAIIGVAVVVVAAGIWFSVRDRAPITIELPPKVEAVEEKQVTGPKVVIMANGERGAIAQANPVVISWASGSGECTLNDDNTVYTVPGNGSQRFNLKFNSAQDTKKYTFTITCGSISDKVTVGGTAQ